MNKPTIKRWMRDDGECAKEAQYIAEDEARREDGNAHGLPVLPMRRGWEISHFPNGEYEWIVR